MASTNLQPVGEESTRQHLTPAVTAATQRVSGTFSGRIPALDGLRGIAILSVLLWHSAFVLESKNRVISDLLAVGKLSWSGVDLFFVLSGFLIGGILLDARDSPNYFKTFYVRRAYRILPLYAATISLFLLWQFLQHVLAIGGSDPSVVPIPSLAYLTFTQNFLMAYWATFGVSGAGMTWSLAVEEQFYLTAPVLVRKIGRSRLVAVLICVVIGAPLLRALLYYRLQRGDFAAYVLMPCRADALSLGVLSAVLVRDTRLWQFVSGRQPLLYWAAGILLVPLGWLMYLRCGPMATPMIVAGYTLLGLFYTCCLLIALSNTGWIQRVLCHKWLMRLGTIAYCTYLLHVTLIDLCRHTLGLKFVEDSNPIQVVGGVLGTVLTLVIASLSWRFFEQPMLRRGHAYKY